MVAKPSHPTAAPDEDDDLDLWNGELFFKFHSWTWAFFE
jgi:hypothetical protein